MKSKYNYTFNDVLELIEEAQVSPWNDLASDIIKDFFEGGLSSGVQSSFNEVGTMSGGSLTYAPYVKQVIDNVYRLHFENYCVFTDFETLFPNECKKFVIKFLTLLNQTAPRYKKLLELYKSQENKLLDKLSTINSGLAKFNDTPQGSGDFSGDTHTTNITKTSSESQVEVRTPIERLKEIQDSYSDVLARWSEEFDNLFLEEGNFDYED